MKKKDKRFLFNCNDDMDNQLCYPHERKNAERLKKKGFIKRIQDENNDGAREGDFLIWLSKKGLKRVKRLYNEKGNKHS